MPTTKDILYGIHSVAILDRSNGYLPYTDGVFEIVGKVGLNFTYENVTLMGGSNPFPFAAEAGAASSEVSMTVRQMNQALAESVAGAITTLVTTSATGTVGTARNGKGTSCINATTGIASVTSLSGSEADLKTGVYIIKVITATTVNIYGTTNADFNSNGTDVDFQDTSMKLLAANLTITAAGVSNATGFGFKLTGGSGTIAMTIGDTAVFEVVPAHTGIKQYSVGVTGQVPPYVGLYFVGQKQADGSNTTVFIPKVKLNGLPINMAEKAFSEFEVSGTAVRTSDPFTANQEIVYRMNNIKGANA
jgi:hypothetical protein